ncbi:sodium-coupled neutral amino acid transporter 3 isoform X3 [Coregonus clupeaformis]|uniref:sodium-coupled neutral amino acid transporter 3 isoform X3 n=1 Tax=Coregonus clupeaformis TaxID=59861 RepID=UPI001BE0AC18|nr:sodium-coupled neutral amino acid transporter 3 isoform X3 [Coregonus clupeaformis]
MGKAMRLWRKPQQQPKHHQATPQSRKLFPIVPKMSEVRIQRPTSQRVRSSCLTWRTRRPHASQILRGKPLLECQCSTWATPSWEVEFWDCRMPWPTQVSFYSCIRAYEQLGQRAFGTPGKMAAGIAITLQNIGAMSSYLYIVKYEFPLVIQAFLGVDKPSGEWYLNGNYLVIMVSISVILPLALMKQLGYLGYTSGFSLTCMVFFLISVIYKKFHTPCPFLDFTFNSTASVTAVTNDTGYNPACVPKMVNLNSQTAYTIPILAFAFVCHPEVLPIYTELKNPTKQRMQHVSNISIVVMYTMYFLAALFGYLTFYGEVESELLHTYSRLDPYDTLILCVRLAVLTAVTLTVPIVLFPVRRAIQQLFFPNKTFYWPRHIAIAVTLLTLINMLVIFAPNILGIFGIIGATSAPCLIFIFPAVFYIRIVPEEEEPMRSTPKILAACFAGIGFLFMIMSLSFILIDWTSGSSKASSGH